MEVESRIMGIRGWEKQEGGEAGKGGGVGLMATKLELARRNAFWCSIAPQGE